MKLHGNSVFCGFATRLTVAPTTHAPQVSDLHARELVPGDVVELRVGDKVR